VPQLIQAGEYAGKCPEGQARTGGHQVNPVLTLLEDDADASSGGRSMLIYFVTCIDSSFSLTAMPQYMYTTVNIYHQTKSTERSDNLYPTKPYFY